MVDEAKVPSYGSKLSNPGLHQCSETGSNVPRNKRAMSEGIEADTPLRSMPTPINVYEDECAFCHSFRTTQIHGPMVCYLTGRIVSSHEINHSSNGIDIYVHWKCLEWAPRVWFEGDTVRNLESEIHRASRLRCPRCGLQGAALGCYYKHCNKSFHVPCAVQMYGCRWDVDNRLVLCPEHVSEVLPCDKQISQTNKGHKFSSLPQSGCPDEEGISNACQGEEMKLDRQEISCYPSDKWVLLGSSLSASEKDFLEDFACWTDSMVTNEWGENVTHVIVGKNAGSAWSRSYEVLMAILFGKWVVRAEWIVDCLELRPDLEDSYEVTFRDDSGKPLDGPKKGRTRAAEGAPKLFSGLHFCLSACMNPGDGGRMRNLIAAAGGSVVERSSSGLHCRLCARGDSSPRPRYFVYDCSVLGEFSTSSLQMEAEEAREHAAAGVRVISHLTVLKAVAAYDAEVMDQERKVDAVSGARSFFGQ